MGNQGPVVVSSQGGVEVAGQGQNVATARADQAEEKKLSVDGKKIYPTDVFADTVHLKTDLTVGGGVALSDGCVQTIHLATNSVNADKILATGLTSTDITFSGTLSGFGIANLGTITGGSIAIGAGGATIGDVAAGVSISGNVIRCIKSAVVTIQIDGSTGIVTANKFQLTADSSSSLDMSLGSLTIGATASLNGTACSTVVTNAATGATAVQPNGTSGTTGLVVNASTRKVETIYLNSSGIAITTASSGARTLLNSAGLAVYDSTHCSVEINSTNGVWVNNNGGATPGITERLSLAGGGTEIGKLYADGDNGVFFIEGLSGMSVYIGTDDDIDMHIGTEATDSFKLYRGTTEVMSFVGNSSNVSFGADVKTASLTLEGGTIDPTIKAAAAPSEGGSSSEPLGSIRMGVGGSLWYTYLDGATNKWTRIYSYQYHP